MQNFQAEVKTPLCAETYWKKFQTISHRHIHWSLPVPREKTIRRFSAFEQISCCSHIFHIIDTWFGNTVWRNTYMASFRSFFDLGLEEIKSRVYVSFGVSTFVLDCSVKFWHDAVQCFSNAMCLCVREKDVLASFYCTDWGRLVAARGEVSK